MSSAVQTKNETISSQRLAGKVALVTGGSRGIGAAIASRLASEGAAVALTYTGNKALAETVVNQLTESGSKAWAFKANVTDTKEIETLVDHVVKVAGKIDILVNNAGVFELAPIDQVDLDHYNRVFDVNVKGVIATTIAAVDKLADGGRIINVSSVAANNRFPNASIYSASKAALDALTRIWAQDLGSRRITVNGVAPGTTDTDMLRAGLSDEMVTEVITKTPLGRLGKPDDIAEIVAFLASDEARWVTGQTIVADGGLNM